MPGDQLQDFLKRPRKIYSYEWTVGSELKQIIKPWALLCSLPDVKKKMAGFARFRGSLKVQILINGSAFHRGMAYASYLPLGNEQTTSGGIFNDGVITTVHGVGVGQPNGAGYHSFSPAGAGFYDSIIGSRRLVPLSQRQHVKLYPSVGLGGDMNLPLVFPHEYVPIDDKFLSSVDVPSRAATTDNLGTLTMQSVGTLGFLGSNSPEAVDITILASFHDDLELVAPTWFQLQAGDVEPMSSKISSAKPSRVPASSTWMGVASTLGPAVARLMGFSNPPLFTGVDSVRVQNVPNLANTQLSARDEVLAADPGATLLATCDSLGGSDDDLLISSLASKPSYVTSVVWNASGPLSASESTLFRAYPCPALSPNIVRSGSSSVQYEQVIPIPMDWLSQCYRLWRGDIIFTFEVITTKFQRGRLKVTFDPLGGAPTDTDLTGKVYTKILDISEGTEFEFVVPYMATTAWLGTPHSVSLRPQLAAGALNYIIPSALEATGDVFPIYDPSCHNGVLSLQVLNTLSNDLDAYVVVSVRAAPNFELSVPCSISPDVSLQDQFFLQAGDLDPIYSNYVGEKSVSVRDLCHRACPAAFPFFNATNYTYAFEVPAAGMPRGVGFNSGDVQMKANAELFGMGSGVPVNYVHWFSSAFDSVRTSHRVQITPVGCPNQFGRCSILVTVVRGISNFFLAGDNTTPGISGHIRLRSRLAMTYIAQWGHLFGNSLNPWGRVFPLADASTCLDTLGGSLIVPYQKNTKFSPSNCMYDFYRPVGVQGSGNLIGEPVFTANTPAASFLCLLSRFFVPQDSVRVIGSWNSLAGGNLIATTSAGSDFSVGRFCNAPTFFRTRTDGTFLRGSNIALNVLVLDKIQDSVQAVYGVVG